MGKKKRKLLVHAQQQVTTEPTSIDRFLRAYGELTDATAELYRRLDRSDTRHQQVHRALEHARGVTQAALTGTDRDGAVPPKVVRAPVGTSLELVRTPRALSEVPVPTFKQAVVAEESRLVPYIGTRGRGHRWPDESSLGRYLRERPLPDESTLGRWRRRRELRNNP